MNFTRLYPHVLHWQESAPSRHSPRQAVNTRAVPIGIPFQGKITRHSPDSEEGKVVSPGGERDLASTSQQTALLHGVKEEDSSSIHASAAEKGEMKGKGRGRWDDEEARKGRITSYMDEGSPVSMRVNACVCDMGTSSWRKHAPFLDSKLGGPLAVSRLHSHSYPPSLPPSLPPSRSPSLPPSSSDHWGIEAGLSTSGSGSSSLRRSSYPYGVGGGSSPRKISNKQVLYGCIVLGLIFGREIGRGGGRRGGDTKEGSSKDD